MPEPDSAKCLSSNSSANSCALRRFAPARLSAEAAPDSSSACARALAVPQLLCVCARRPRMMPCACEFVRARVPASSSVRVTARHVSRQLLSMSLPACDAHAHAFTI